MGEAQASVAGQHFTTIACGDREYAPATLTRDLLDALAKLGSFGGSDRQYTTRSGC